MNTYIYYAISFIFSALLALTLSAIVSTQLVLADIVSFGVQVPFSDRLNATLHDIVGLLPMFGPLLAIALLCGFAVAGLVVKYISTRRLTWYCTAGALSFISMILLMKLSLHLTPLAAARNTSGLLALAGCCAVSGAVFHGLTRGRYNERQTIVLTTQEASH